MIRQRPLRQSRAVDRAARAATARQRAVHHRRAGQPTTRRRTRHCGRMAPRLIEFGTRLRRSAGSRVEQLQHELGGHLLRASANEPLLITGASAPCSAGNFREQPDTDVILVAIARAAAARLCGCAIRADRAQAAVPKVIGASQAGAPTPSRTRSWKAHARVVGGNATFRLGEGVATRAVVRPAVRAILQRELETRHQLPLSETGNPRKATCSFSAPRHAQPRRKVKRRRRWRRP